MPATSYHHGNLREALVHAAVAAARDRGPEGLALRELARTVGVSHNAAYRHFADRNAIVDEVATVAMEELVEQLQHEVDLVPADDAVLAARRRLAALGRGYVRFAVAQPGLFRTLFTAYPEVPTGEGETGKPDPYGMLNQALDGLVAVGFMAADAREGADSMCWSTVHGYSVLVTEGPLRGLAPAERDAILERMLEAIDRGYAATTGSATRPGELV